jgi:putative transposase
MQIRPYQSQGACNSPLPRASSRRHIGRIVAWVLTGQRGAWNHGPHVSVLYDVVAGLVHTGVLSAPAPAYVRVLHMSLRRGVGMVRSEGHHRRSVRLGGYDYAQPGAYFVTMCTHGRVCIFGDVVNGEMIVNECGQRVTEEWLYTGLLRPDIVLDAFVVMPNHLHGIVIIMERDHRRGVLHTPSVLPTSRLSRGVLPTSRLSRGVLPTSRLGRGVLHTPSLEQAPSYVTTGVDSTPVRGGDSPSRTIGAIVRGVKAATVGDINRLRGAPTGAPVWQRNYYEHVVRGTGDLDRIRAYIADNPARWLEDENNPARTKPGQAHDPTGSG